MGEDGSFGAAGTWVNFEEAGEGGKGMGRDERGFEGVG